MEQVSPWVSRQLAEAIVAFTGWGRASWPQRDESAIIDQFGEDAAGGPFGFSERISL